MLRYRLRRIETVLSRAGCRCTKKSPAPMSLETPQDVIKLVHEQIEALRADGLAGTVERARAIAYLASVARKTLETGTLAARLEMLELVLKQRQEPKPR